jgi:hypothetical protein
MKSLYLLRHAKSSWRDPGLKTTIDHSASVAGKRLRQWQHISAGEDRARLGDLLYREEFATDARPHYQGEKAAKGCPRTRNLWRRRTSTLGTPLEPAGKREIRAADWSQSSSARSRVKACRRRFEQAAPAGWRKISDGCNGEFPLRQTMEGVGATLR